MGKKVVMIAEIVFALLFVIALAVMMNPIISKTNSANTKLVNTLEMTDNTMLNTYTDGSVHTGTAVISCIDNIRTIGGDLKLEVLVTTGGGGPYKYGYTEGFEATPKSYIAPSSSADEYINTKGMFTCEVQYTESGVVKALEFTQTE